MAVLLSTIRHRVNTKLRNTDDRRATFDPVELDQVIAEAYLVRQASLPPPHVMTTSAITISASASTFTLPTTSSAEYGGDIQIRLQSNGRYLERLTIEEMQARRSGQTDAQLIAGASIPDTYAFFEENDQEVQAFCYPAAKVAEVCDLYAAIVAADLRATNLDTVSAALSRYAVTGLVYDVSAELLMMMPDEDIKLRRLDRAVANVWRKQAAVMFYQEEARRHSLEGVGRTLRNVP